MYAFPNIWKTRYTHWTRCCHVIVDHLTLALWVPPRGSVTAFEAKYVINDEMTKKVSRNSGLKSRKCFLRKGHSEIFLEQSQRNDFCPPPNLRPGLRPCVQG